MDNPSLLVTFCRPHVLWLKAARLPPPIESSQSPNMRPSAFANQMDRSTRRDFLASFASLGLLSLPWASPVEALGSNADLGKGGTLELRHRLEQVLGTMPTRPGHSFSTLESVRLPEGWRHKIEFLSEPADALFATPPDFIRAYLFGEVPALTNYPSVSA